MTTNQREQLYAALLSYRDAEDVARKTGLTTREVKSTLVYLRMHGVRWEKKRGRKVMAI